MTPTPAPPNEIDQWIAANLRTRREALGLSQEDVAERMRAYGHVFSQNTVWKIETGQRQVRVAEFRDLERTVAVDDEVIGAGRKKLLGLDLPPEDYKLKHDFHRANDQVYRASQELHTAVLRFMRAKLNLGLAEAAMDRAYGEERPVLERDNWTEPPEILALRARLEFEIFWNEEDTIESRSEEFVAEAKRRIDAAAAEFQQVIATPSALPEIIAGVADDGTMRRGGNGQH